MVDVDTFITTLYVMVDDFCKLELAVEKRPGPQASLSRSEVITLAMLGQWRRFSSERDFYRYVQRHLRDAFPNLPHRAQFNRQVRRHKDTIVAFFMHLVQRLDAQNCAYEALDCSAVVIRNAKRRGAGWLAGLTNIGWSNRLGWYEGFNMLLAVNPTGTITGFGFGPASAKDQPLADTFFAVRHRPNSRLPSVGAPSQGPYVADKGFQGPNTHRRWRRLYGASVICAPQSNSKRPWPRRLRRWLASIRQIVETVYEKLHNTFRLCAERPHDLVGFQARLAAKIALHNFCILLNGQLGRSSLAFADLLDW